MLFEILKGLPSYGPSALNFSPIDQGNHREGLVVRFENPEGDAWVGNFQPGSTGCNEVLSHPNGYELIVIAGGQAYQLNPQNPKSWTCFGGSIEYVLKLQDNSIVFGNGLWFELLGETGLLWKTRRISWDGMRDIHCVANEIAGQAWDAINKNWDSFSVNLTDGSVSGGAYKEK